METESDVANRDVGRSDVDVLIADRDVALAHFFQVHRPRLRKMIELRLHPRLASRVDPEDVMQEAFVDAATRLDEYVADPSVPLFIWIRFLVNQQIAQVHRWHYRKKRNAGREVQDASPPTRNSGISFLNQLIGSDTSPSLVACRNELQTTLGELVDKLESTDREILFLRHFEELTNQEAATELAITTAAASKRYVRAIERLRSVAIENQLDL